MFQSTPRPVPRSLAALVLSSTLAIGACASEASDPLGGGGATGDAPEVPDDVRATLADAIDATRAVDSATADLTLSVGSDFGGGVVELTGDLSRDDVGTVTAASATDGTRIEIEMRSDGDTVWLTSDAPQIADALPPGIDWVEASVDDLRDDDVWTGIDTTFDVLSVLRGIDDVTDGGTTEVGGDEVRLLEGEVDWDQARDESGSEERDRLEDTITLTGDTVAREFTATVGLDAVNRVRFLDVEVVAGAPTGADDDSVFGDQEITLQIELEVPRIDHQVEAPEEPPADETVSIDEVPEIADALAEGL